MRGANTCHYLNVTGKDKIGTAAEPSKVSVLLRRTLERTLEDVEARIEHVPRNV